MDTKKSGLAVLVGLFFLLGRSSSGGRKILLLGDSQSVGSASPGGRLAELLRGAGFEVRVLAVGGKTAAFFASGDGLRRFAAELAQRPNVVLVFMGSNEAANVAAGGSLKSQIKGHQAVRDLIQKTGARPLFVGPPNFRANTEGANAKMPLVDTFPSLVPRLRAVYGGAQFLDARDLTPDHEGIHFFSPAGCAEAFAEALAPAVMARLS